MRSLTPENIFILAIARCALLLPLFIISWSKKAEGNIKYVCLFFGVVLIDQLLLHFLASVTLFHNQQWNWVGKAVECVLALLLVFKSPWLNIKEVGLTFQVRNKKMVFGIIGMILFITFATQYFQNTAKPYPDAETLLFQFTMPGIAEELMFRGVLLGLLNKVYTAKINIFGVLLGWAALITSVLFGVVHAFNFYSNSIDFNLGYFFSSFLMGLIFVFIKEKSQSLVPSIICHNLYNAVIVFF